MTSEASKWGEVRIRQLSPLPSVSVEDDERGVWVRGVWLRVKPTSYFCEECRVRHLSEEIWMRELSPLPSVSVKDDERGVWVREVWTRVKPAFLFPWRMTSKASEWELSLLPSVSVENDKRCIWVRGIWMRVKPTSCFCEGWRARGIWMRELAHFPLFLWTTSDVYKWGGSEWELSLLPSVSMEDDEHSIWVRGVWMRVKPTSLYFCEGWRAQWRKMMFMDGGRLTFQGGPYAYVPTKAYLSRKLLIVHSVRY